ncbi:MAG: GDSL-type esterase/lipase family protein [Candidatus Pseudobacter hemicellulosilyticus]|uniref:GDSL-type esterase/lipase family protein n=1 Tax=Candidatus Pseudobacter hemicellulosilyticus TaxID=3121375 RepID=A0AAJ5WTH1_9BACT|nr:MAG: GDSL-type esterase/lipase family protein [Pseudobacter sp.]
MKILQCIPVLLLLLACTLRINAQEPPFAKDIAAFKQKDSAAFPPKKAILFVGSSSFTYWKDVQDYFPGHVIINRGFGGSSLPDVIRYADDIIFPYQPKQILIYCGENDLAASDTVTGATVFNRFVELYQLIRAKLPRVPVAYVAMKPSPSREKNKVQREEGNRLIKEYLKGQKRTSFIDVQPRMLKEDGHPDESLFIQDMLHMNPKGYAIWKEIIEPYLVK